MPVSFWPSAVDYQTALQIPEISFSRDDLRNASVETSSWGLPVAITGNIAVVFPLIRNGEKIAVRCFTRQQVVGGMMERYGALRRHLVDFPSLHLPALRHYEFRADGLQLQGNSYPIMVMPWLRGKQLAAYIDQHVEDGEKLVSLADRWKEFTHSLRTAHFAHGDLSDGNILVDDDQNIQLIDFDAAYVPSLKTKPPLEVGKPNFQHPDRLNTQAPLYGYYGENVDAFANLLIYVSLRALASDPSLWDDFHDGDNLIFTNKDFQNLEQTPIWNRIETNPDDQVRLLVKVLKVFVQKSVDKLSHLDEVLGSLPTPKDNENSPSQSIVGESVSCVPGLEKERPPSSPQRQKVVPVPASSHSVPSSTTSSRVHSSPLAASDRVLDRALRSPSSTLPLASLEKSPSKKPVAFSFFESNPRFLFAAIIVAVFVLVSFLMLL